MVIWDTPLNGAGKGWIGKPDFVAAGRTTRTPTVAVVNVTVTTPTSPFTASTKPFDRAAPYLKGGYQVKQIAAGDPSVAAPNDIGLTWKASITLDGPSKFSITQINVGFVQNVTEFKNDGDTYTVLQGNTSRATSTFDGSGLSLFDQSKYPGGTYATGGWYSTDVGTFNGNTFISVLHGSTVTGNNKTLQGTINQEDTPTDGPPQNIKAFRLKHMQLKFGFDLFICAQTVDAYNFNKFVARNVLVEESSATWSYVGDGSIDPSAGYKYTPDSSAKVTPPTAWSAQIQTGAMPTISDINFNTKLENSEQYNIQ